VRAGSARARRRAPRRVQLSTIHDPAVTQSCGHEVCRSGDYSTPLVDDYIGAVVREHQIDRAICVQISHSRRPPGMINGTGYLSHSTLGRASLTRVRIGIAVA
jgi:hypothetical protein